MPSPPWAIPPQLDFLNKRKPGYNIAQANRTVKTYRDQIIAEFFLIWPNQEAETTALALWKATQAPDAKSQKKRQKGLAAALETQPVIPHADWIEGRRKNIKNWFNNHAVEKNQVKSVQITLPKSSARISSEHHIYSKRYYQDRVKPLVDAEIGDMPGVKPSISIINKAVAEAYKAESEEVKAEIRKAQDEERKAKNISKDDEISLLQAIDCLAPEECLRQQAVLPGLVKEFCDLMEQRTGWSFSVLAGGPDPARGGNIRSIAIHTGYNEYGHSFAKALPSYTEDIMKPFSSFLESVYPIPIRNRYIISDEQKATAVKSSSSGTRTENEDDTTRPPSPMPEVQAAPTTNLTPADNISSPAAPALTTSATGSLPTSTPDPSLALATATPAPLPASGASLAQPNTPTSFPSTENENRGYAPVTPTGLFPGIDLHISHSFDIPKGQDPGSRSQMTTSSGAQPTNVAGMQSSASSETQSVAGGMQSINIAGMETLVGGGTWSVDGRTQSMDIPEMQTSANSGMWSAAGGISSMNVAEMQTSASDGMWSVAGSMQLTNFTEIPTSANSGVLSGLAGGGASEMGRQSSFFDVTRLDDNQWLEFCASAGLDPNFNFNYPGELTGVDSNPNLMSSTVSEPINQPSGQDEGSKNVAPDYPDDLASSHSPQRSPCFEDSNGPSQSLPESDAMEKPTESEGIIFGARQRKPAVKGEVRPLTAKDPSDSLPDWLTLATNYLKDGINEPLWAECIDRWLQFERDMLGESTSHRLPAHSRPALLGKWLKARTYDELPVIDDVTEMASQWIRWWNAIQPKWRQSQSEGDLPKSVSVAIGKENIGALKKGGATGLVTALIGLKWWEGVQKTDERWIKAVTDIMECLEVFSVANNKRKTSDTTEGGNKKKRKTKV